MTPNGLKILRVKLDDGFIYHAYEAFRKEGKIVAIWPDAAFVFQDMNDIPVYISWLKAAHKDGAQDEEDFWERSGE